MFLAVLLIPTASAAEVEVPVALVKRFLPPNPEEPEEPPGPRLTHRRVELREVRHSLRGEPSIEVRARWQVLADQPGWVELPLPDPSFWAEEVRFDDRDVPVRGMRDGSRRVLVRVEGPGMLTLRGELPGELRRGVELSLPAAAIGEVRVRTDDEVVVRGDGRPAVERDGLLWTGGTALWVSTAKRLEKKDRGTIVVASTGLGVTVLDGALSVKARAAWEVRRGRVSELRLEAPDAGADLEVSGGQLASWKRQGTQIIAQLTEPASGRVALDLSWTRSLPNRDEASAPLPQLRAVDVFRSTTAVQLARDGDRDIVPELSGWSAVASAELPEVARGLVEGTPVSAWVGGSAGSLDLVRFRPVSGPATLVDIAAWTGAFAVDGRLLLRGHLAVRNDRGAFLEVTPPPNSRLVSATVDGEPARVGRSGDTLLLPLAKSVETVQGLLSFPVNVVFLQDTPGFAKKDARQLALPELGAEVAATRVTLHLPPGWTNRIPLGERGTIRGFSAGEGLTYGFSVGDTKVAEADRLYQDALGSWMSNDFDTAQRALDDLRSLGGDNDNVQRLQSNLDVVNGVGRRGGDKAMEARVKQQAQARAVEQEVAQSELVEQADRAWAAGDYDTAESAFNQAIALGRTLEKLETGGAVEAKNVNQAIAGKLEQAKDEKKKKRKGASLAFGAKKSAPPSADPGPGFDLSTLIVLEDDEIGVVDAVQDVDSDGASERGIVAPNEDDGFKVPGDLPLKGRAFETTLTVAPPVAVTASALDVVIPGMGEIVRYQRLLTRAGEPVVLALDAKKRRER